MATFKARTSAPSTTDKNYLHYAKSKIGGYNYCIHISGGSCLPNCVGYAWGRWRELLGKKPELSRANAENWYDYTSDGYDRGKTPKLGAVICWRKGQAHNESDGAGHVGIVEKITKDSITVSMSAYGGTRWFTREFAIGKYNYNGFTFQGFIYPPVEFEEKKAKYSTGTYKVTKVKTYLKVREGAGTKYRVKKFNELTQNAQAQIIKLKGKEAKGYVNGVTFDVSEIKDDFWGKTPSGWVSLRYCTKVK